MDSPVTSDLIKTNSSNCSLEKWAVTAVRFRAAEDVRQKQKAVAAYFITKKLLLFAFPRRQLWDKYKKQ